MMPHLHHTLTAIDRERCMRALEALSESDYEPASAVSLRCGLTVETTKRSLGALMRYSSGLVDWKYTNLRKPRAPIYLWRRIPGALEKINR